MAIEFVQYDDFYSISSETTIANDTALSTTSGNFIVVIVGLYSTTTTVSSISDTAGNTYVKAIGENLGLWNERKEIWYAENITGNANNITTVTFSASVLYRYISVAEFSGVATSSSLDDISHNETEGTEHSSGNADNLIY